jgi:ABC-type nickel/cobalt efflux system permease component RcnA
MEFLLALASGFTVGCLHAFDADHIAAVSALASRTRRAVVAMRLGLMWGLGHSSILLLVGGSLVALRLPIPPEIERWAETLVGVLLVGIGAWSMWQVRRDWHQHVHRHAHDGAEHLHLHGHQSTGSHEHEHHHGNSLFAVGVAHGLAGTGAVIVLVPVALASAPLNAALFLACFGAGTMVAMALFSLLFNAAIHLTRSVHTITILRGASGLASLVVGAVWIYERLH